MALALAAAAALTSRDHLLICVACGTQFNASDQSVISGCHICDDPRQYVPATGQSFTTLSALRTTHKNIFTPISNTDLTAITTVPKFGIGQRALLLRHPNGNILWDCITYLDAATISYIKSLGGLQAIVISHPHFYSSHLLWADVFQCPVYLSSDDQDWLSCADDVRVFDPEGWQGEMINARQFITSQVFEIPFTVKEGKQPVKAIKLGGHFPGSLVLLWEGRLLIADTLLTTPSGIGKWEPRGRPEGANTFSFMWSIPNMIPLPPSEIARMWSILKEFDFKSTHGGFTGWDIFDDKIKQRIWQSMKIQVGAEGYKFDEFLEQYQLEGPK